MVSGTADDEAALTYPPLRTRRKARSATVTQGDLVAPTALDHGVHGDQAPGIEDLDLLGELVDLDETACPVRHAVEVAAHAHETLVRDAPLQTQHRAVVENLAGHAAQGREGGDVAAQDCLQVLVQDEACPDVAGVAQHHREQSDDAGHPRLVGERDLEAGEVDLSLLAGWGLEADLEGSG